MSRTQSQDNPTRDEPGPFTFMVNMLKLHNRTTTARSGEWDMWGSSGKSARSSLKIILKTYHLEVQKNLLVTSQLLIWKSFLVQGGGSCNRG